MTRIPKRLHKCPYLGCDYRSSRMKIMDDHVNAHAPGEKVFKCHHDKCALTYGSSRMCRRHMMYEHPVRPNMPHEPDIGTHTVETPLNDEVKAATPTPEPHVAASSSAMQPTAPSGEMVPSYAANDSDASTLGSQQTSDTITNAQVVPSVPTPEARLSPSSVMGNSRIPVEQTHVKNTTTMISAPIIPVVPPPGARWYVMRVLGYINHPGIGRFAITVIKTPDLNERPTIAALRMPSAPTPGVQPYASSSS
ncbi:hypothetical protein BDQ17DRAFT_1332619 [Cyathus striatus]|nr:hypothetical protein BDQ17DRAFT_1332619 [Cyathus striatus]